MLWYQYVVLGSISTNINRNRRDMKVLPFMPGIVWTGLNCWKRPFGANWKDALFTKNRYIVTRIRKCVPGKRENCHT